MAYQVCDSFGNWQTSDGKVTKERSMAGSWDQHEAIRRALLTDNVSGQTVLLDGKPVFRCYGLTGVVETWR
jgi:hypothetical protein